MADRDTCDLLCLDLPKAERVRALMPDVAELEQRAAVANALADPTLLAVALALREAEAACVCDLAWVAGRAENLFSHHVRALRTLGLAESRRDGKMVLYRLTPRGRALLAAVLAAEEDARA